MSIFWEFLVPNFSISISFKWAEKSKTRLLSDNINSAFCLFKRLRKTDRCFFMLKHDVWSFSRTFLELSVEIRLTAPFAVIAPSWPVKEKMFRKIRSFEQSLKNLTNFPKMKGKWKFAKNASKISRNLKNFNHIIFKRLI